MRKVLSVAEYCTLAKAADFGARPVDGYGYSDFAPSEQNRRICKAWLEGDRLWRANEAGFQTAIAVLVPPSCSPKNDLLLGWPLTGVLRELGSSTPRQALGLV